MRVARLPGHEWRARRIRFTAPEDVSPLVADFFAQRMNERRKGPRRLLVSSFILLDPQLTMEMGAIPFWMTFNTDSSAASLDAYLSHRPAFDRIDMTLFSHGVRSIGLVPLERWAELRGRARDGGDLLGVSPRAFPKDFGNFIRYHGDLLHHARPGAPLSRPVSDARPIPRRQRGSLSRRRIRALE